MENRIREDSVLVPAPGCVIREQEEQYLIYNPKTDEMHLVPATGFYVYQLCDGLRTVGEIAETITAAMAGQELAVRSALLGFLDELIERGILQVDGDE